MSKLIYKISIVILFCSFLVSGCTSLRIGINENETKNKLRDISYEDEDMSESDYTVMIKEQGEFVPYLVITDKYNGSKNCLLLRKYLLDENYRFNEEAEVCSYYGDCELDSFLNDEYIKLYSAEIQDMMVMSKVEITSYWGLVSGEGYKENIDRKIFILSYHELCNRNSSSRSNEGKEIYYFEQGYHLIATKSDGTMEAYWLRTPVTSSTAIMSAISYEGISFSCGVMGLGEEYKLGVRPAFCLPRDTSIIEVDGLYYIEADYNSLDVMNNAEDRRTLLYENILTPRQTEIVKPIDIKYRKEGYNEFVRPGLSQVMDAHKNENDYLYHVALYSIYEIDLDEILFDINNTQSDVYLNKDYWTLVENPYYDDTYYYIFTADEILALSEYKITLAYVGSGNCDMEKANWDTTEGILEYCELYGDGYVAK